MDAIISGTSLFVVLMCCVTLVRCQEGEVTKAAAFMGLMLLYCVWFVLNLLRAMEDAR